MSAISTMVNDGKSILLFVTMKSKFDSIYQTTCDGLAGVQH